MTTTTETIYWWLLSIEHQGHVKSDEIVIMFDAYSLIVAVDSLTRDWRQYRRVDPVQMFRQLDVTSKISICR